MDASDWDERYRAVTQPWGIDPAGTVATRVADLDPGTAVDLACGDGRHARWLADHGWSVTGVDYSSVAIDRARSADVDSAVKWEVGDATSWTTESEVDLVLVSFLHLPLAELVDTLRRVAGWVAPGGRVMYLGHSIENYHRGVGGPPEPDILPGISDLARAAEGFRVYALEHVVRAQDDGFAIDILLEFGPWDRR
ncbi:class I SAM-dependent methyltransferase [Rhodococcus globerulus]|uniref:Class I SAM-dependent methyltransferase n=1 Tax=Rhodococcus globerulus TaxID=33008 RepID=A0ABU4C0M6_RHOGO|nr:class I SAM-dependent methyltransferase [Rhodococcus globerulus]MDV6270061.1 class I SAM-dependent methyltransferase [Rhodococcus globerulus]